MDSRRRNIVKYGQLQIKTHKKGGTLLRKKVLKKKIKSEIIQKIIFEDEKWVVLCVHDEKIPLFEWYNCEEDISKHEPFKVEDLFNCLFVNTIIGDDHCMIIGFKDETRPPLEFSAVNSFVLIFFKCF